MLKTLKGEKGVDFFNTHASICYLPTRDRLVDTGRPPSTDHDQRTGAYTGDQKHSITVGILQLVEIGDHKGDNDR